MKIRYFSILFVFILIICSFFVLAQEESVYETGMDPTYDELYSAQYPNYQDYYTSVDYYGSTDADLTNYVFSNFNDWENLNLQNPSLDLNSIDNDQFKNIVAREDWKSYDNVKDNFNDRVSSDPIYINDDPDMMDSWLSSFDSGAGGIQCFGGENNCAIKSYDKESGEIVTMNSAVFERSREKYPDNVALQETHPKVTFNINDPYFDGAIINDKGEVITLFGPTVKGGKITVEDGESESDPKTIIIGSGSASIEGGEFDNTKVIDGDLYVSDSVAIFGQEEDGKHTIFEVEGDTVNIDWNSASRLFLSDPNDVLNELTFVGDISSLTIDGDSYSIESGSNGYTIEYTDSKTYDSIVAFNINGQAKISSDDIDLDGNNIVNKIRLSQGSTLTDYSVGYISTVSKDTTFSYQEDGCSQDTNCVKYYLDDQEKSVMDVNIDSANKIDIHLVNIETDNWLDEFKVEEIPNDCEGCEVTLNDNNHVRLEFTDQPVVAQGDLSKLTVGRVESSFTADENFLVDNVEIVPEGQHTQIIENQHSIICSNCRSVGIVRSESVGLSAEEIQRQMFIYAVRVANSPEYGSEWGASGDLIYAWPGKNQVNEGQKMSTEEYYRLYKNNPGVKYSYGCINLVQGASEYATGGSKNWDKFWSSDLVASAMRDTSEDFQTEYIALGNAPVPERVLSDPDVVVVRFPTREELSGYLSTKSAGSPIGYYKYGEEKHTAIKGYGLDTVEAHVGGAGDISVDENKLELITFYDGFLVTSVKDSNNFLDSEEQQLVADATEI